MADATAPDRIHQVLQAQYGRILGYLIRICGNFDDAEDITQDVILAALTHWEQNGPPDNPAAWLFATAKNRATDRFRQRGVHDRVHQQLADHIDADQPERIEKTLEDDLLRLIFTCCHPAIGEDARVALTLKSVTGLSLEEVARAFLTTTRAMEQRLVRAKRKIQSAGTGYDLPVGAALETRVSSVLQTIYLLFNEGYSATAGDQLIRKHLCREAIHLAGMMQRLFPDRAEVMSLFALLLFQDSRRDARVTDSGDLILLPNQDRSYWDRRQIQQASALLDKALHLRQRPGPYQFQASIAALHAEAAQPEDTDWAQITLLYSRLLEQEYTQVLHLNYAVAIAMTGKVQLAIAEMETIAHALDDYFPFFCARADLHRQTGNSDASRADYRRALQLTDNESEQRFVTRQLQSLDK